EMTRFLAGSGLDDPDRAGQGDALAFEIGRQRRADRRGDLGPHRVGLVLEKAAGGAYGHGLLHRRVEPFAAANLEIEIDRGEARIEARARQDSGDTLLIGESER